MPRLEHIGIAVENGQVAIECFERLLGKTPYKIERVEREGIDTLFIDLVGAKLELLASTHPESPVAKFLMKRGSGLHHLAVEITDIDAELVRVKEAGFTVLSDTPLDGADGKKVFFVHPRDCCGVLVEFCQQARAVWVKSEVEVSDGVLRVLSAGPENGTPALLLHDLDSSPETDFNHLLPSLERSMRVIAFDIAERKDYEYASSVLESFGVEAPAVVVGRGTGVTAALQAALRNPGGVRNLVLVDPPDSLDISEDVPNLEIPVLVCSSLTESVESALALAKAIPQATLSVIPPATSAESHLGDLIVGVATWG